MLIGFFKQINIQEKRILWYLVGALFFVLLFYGYFVNATIINIVDRQNIIKEVYSLESLIGDMEAQYNNLRSILTYEHAALIGFNEPSNQIFVSQKQLVRGSLFEI